MVITKKVEERVYPEEGSQPPELLHELSELDQMVGNDLVFPVVLFFTKAENGANVSEVLKASLRKVLAIFYPIAGRLVERPGGGGRFDISCRNQGVVFTEAWADCPLSSFDPTGPHSMALCSLRSSFDPSALFHLQVTHFTCRGFCLCLELNHIVCDAQAFDHFMKCWVEIMNGKTSLTVDPYFNRSLLRETYTLPKSLPSHNYSQLFTRNFALERRIDSKSTFECKIFPFTPDFIESLIQDAKLSYRPSRFECIVAHLWKNHAKASKLALKDQTRACYLVDSRKRFEPPLPNGYFGNAIFLAAASTKVEDLLMKPLSYAMHLIREATSTLSSDYMKSALNELKAQQVPILFRERSEQYVPFTTWLNFQFCDLAFPWGKPYDMRVPMDLKEFVIDPNVFFILSPSTLGKGHVDALVVLKSEHVKDFETLVGQHLV